MAKVVKLAADWVEAVEAAGVVGLVKGLGAVVMREAAVLARVAQTRHCTGKCCSPCN